ncbi:MAG: NADH-quinone oxidoreductase subunit NuoG [Fimbriimonadaceae bacterium]|nr:NADH-quinone oxidoreductase subunit NuoG [Fimbriimonadaceae bacterium]
MASVAQEQMVTISINDVEIQVPKDELIVESVKRLGLEVPIFCYHPRMKPVGMCRMCLVDVGFKQPDGTVRKMPKPQAACTLPASDNMVIYTDTEQIHKDRKGVLEFLLINHPLDCPICDRGGECPLQNNTIAYGPSTSRFVEMKRHLPKAYPLSQYVTLDLERCIQCGRCVRFTEEISGDSQLAFRFRGSQMQPSTYQLTDFESKFSGNVIEICPVGALTSSRYRFRARPWDLETKPGICTVTPCGTNIWFDHRAGKFIRINGRTNEQVNEEWTADRCKFGHDFYNSPARLTAPNRRNGNDFVRSSWGEVTKEVVEHLTEAAGNSALLISPKSSNEAIFLGQKLFREHLGSHNIDHRTKGDFLGHESRVENVLGVAPLQSAIADLEFKDSVLIFGSSLADEQPMSFLRVRKGWFQRGMKVVVASSHPTEADTFAHVILRYNAGSEAHAAAAIASAMGAAPNVKLADALKKSGLDEADVKLAAEVLKTTNSATITTHSMTVDESGIAAYHILAGLAATNGGTFNYMGPECNTQGAIALGGLPDVLPGGAKANGMNTRQILQAASEGKIKTLFLVDFDPIDDYHETDLATKALENVDFLIYAASVPGSSAAYASVVLPLALPAEQDGTYTSSEGRVQRMNQIIPAPGESKAAWKVFTELLLRIKPSNLPFNAGEVMGEIAKAVPAYEPATVGKLSSTGYVLPPTQANFNSEAFAGVLQKLP